MAAIYLEAEEEIAAVGPTEDDRVIDWRVERLAAAGFSEFDAVVLAHERHVDLHYAVSLLRNGCSTATAYRILL